MKEVSVHDPVYVVRKRLGEKFNGSESREEQIRNMEVNGENIDHSVSSEIRSDFENEVGDILSNLGGDGLGGMENPMDELSSEMSREERQQKIEDIMRFSSLRIAHKAYPVFKSIVVN